MWKVKRTRETELLVDTHDETTGQVVKNPLRIITRKSESIVQPEVQNIKKLKDKLQSPKNQKLKEM